MFQFWIVILICLPSYFFDISLTRSAGTIIIRLPLPFESLPDFAIFVTNEDAMQSLVKGTI